MISVRRLFFLAIFSAALLVGFKAGEKFDLIADFFSDPIDINAMPSVPIPDNNQYNLLIIGTDDAEKPDAQLESIWLAAHAENTSNITLIPVFPSLEDSTQNLILAEAFQLENGKPSRKFWDAMQNTNLWWNGYMITDISATINMIDLLGGVQISDKLLNGRQAVGSIPPWESDPQTAVNSQMLVLHGLCDHVAKTQSLNLKAATELIVNNIRSIKRTSALLTNLSVSSKLRENLNCTFPTIEQPIIPSRTNP